MVDLSPPPDASLVDWTRWSQRNSGLATVGPEQIPQLEPAQHFTAPHQLSAFDKHGQVLDKRGALLHFYVSDRKLRPLLSNPGRYVSRFADFGGVMSPDFSVYRCMPQHQRIFSVWASRAVGAYYQSHGLLVIPTVRWATPADYEFCFLGLPSNAVVAVSTHGCSRESGDRHYFRHGLIELLGRLSPPTVIVHGPMPESVFHGLAQRATLLHYPSDTEYAHAKAA